MRFGKIKIDRKILQIIFFVILSILTVIFIFSNSMQSARVSASQSRVVASSIQKIIDGDAVGVTRKFHSIVRKIAHVIEFAFLGFGLGGLFYSIKLSYGKKYISLPFLIGLLVGICDEFIQMFGTRRKSLVSDVLIDFGGVAIGLLTVVVIVILINKIKRKRKQ